jgi:uncharacterized membrane protein YhaH (DUF805 family)
MHPTSSGSSDSSTPLSQGSGKRAEFRSNAFLEFLFPYKLNRLQYFIRVNLLLLATAIYPVDFDATSLASHQGYLAGLVAILAYGIWCIALPRIRDCGLSAWTVLLLAIPIAGPAFGIALMFKSSSLPLGFADDSNFESIDSKSPAPSSLAGASCHLCGQKLLLSIDGKLTPEGLVVCNSCAAA